MSRILRHRYGHARGSRYEIYAIYPKLRGDGYTRKRYLTGRARDANEALTELFRLRHSYPEHQRIALIVIDTSAKRGRLAPTVTEAELRRRQSAGG